VPYAPHTSLTSPQGLQGLIKVVQKHNVEGQLEVVPLRALSFSAFLVQLCLCRPCARPSRRTGKAIERRICVRTSYMFFPFINRKTVSPGRTFFSADPDRCHPKHSKDHWGAIPCICFSPSNACHFLSSSTHLHAFALLQTLIEAVQKHGEGRWEEMFQHFSSDRTAAQLMQRWALIHKRSTIAPPDSETPEPLDTLGREAGRILRSTDSRLRHGGGWGQPRSTRSSTGVG
jgi:hypothetical protein